MDAYQHAAALASRIAFTLDAYVENDTPSAPDYQGPHLLVLAHQAKLITFTATGRAVVDIGVERMQHLLSLARDAAHEPYRAGADTADARPITRYQLHTQRMIDSHESFRTLSVNHYGAGHRALGPHWSALVAAIRQSAGGVTARAAEAWDFATTWLGPLALPLAWEAGQVIELSGLAAAFEHDGPVYLRVGQPPAASELYLYESGTLIHAADRHQVVSPVPLRDWHITERWVLPCGGGTILVTKDWQRIRRIVVHATDVRRPFYIQRG